MAFTDYAQAEAPVTLSAVQKRTFDRCLSDAANIREQIAECVKLASGTRDRLAGSYPEACGTDEGDTICGGAIGELNRIQGGTIDLIADLRRTLENISQHI